MSDHSILYVVETSSDRVELSHSNFLKNQTLAFQTKNGYWQYYKADRSNWSKSLGSFAHGTKMHGWPTYKIRKAIFGQGSTIKGIWEGYVEGDILVQVPERVYKKTTLNTSRTNGQDY